MKKLQIRELAGENCITLEDGQKVFENIQPELKADQVVALDFEGVNVMASPFFNAAIGQLLKDFKPEDLRRLVVFENLDAFGESVLRRVIENAKRYYSADEAVRKAVDDILEEQSEAS